MTFLCIVSILNAQTRQLTGLVTTANNIPVASASVIVKGTNMATVTSESGAFTLVIPNRNIEIEVSAIGFATKRALVDVEQKNITIIMDQSETSLSEVVVTALGIKRDKKTLSYSSQQVEGAELRKTAQINFMDAMSGKVAGIDIKTSSSGAGGSTRAVLRGNRSLSGLSDPLYDNASHKLILTFLLIVNFI